MGGALLVEPPPRALHPNLCPPSSRTPLPALSGQTPGIVFCVVSSTGVVGPGAHSNHPLSPFLPPPPFSTSSPRPDFCIIVNGREQRVLLPYGPTSIVAPPVLSAFPSSATASMVPYLVPYYPSPCVARSFTVPPSSLRRCSLAMAGVPRMSRCRTSPPPPEA